MEIYPKEPLFMPWKTPVPQQEAPVLSVFPGGVFNMKIKKFSGPSFSAEGKTSLLKTLHLSWEQERTSNFPFLPEFFSTQNILF